VGASEEFEKLPPNLAPPLLPALSVLQLEVDVVRSDVADLNLMPRSEAVHVQLPTITSDVLVEDEVAVWPNYPTAVWPKTLASAWAALDSRGAAWQDALSRNHAAMRNGAGTLASRAGTLATLAGALRCTGGVGEEG
jgi:hypothetical protein